MVGKKARQSGWSWSLFSGVVSLALAIMIWRQFPVSGVWAVGTLAGITWCSAAPRWHRFAMQHATPPTKLEPD
jgi:uncharacterized membrane protein HdeD (DUF308 family)